MLGVWCFAVFLRVVGDPGVCCSMFVVFLIVVCCLSIVVHWLVVVVCSLLAARCSLFVVCCSMFDYRVLSLVVC